jgi:uroporphyrin-III C-methyltransferase / precorrin-2 dehydrogenase / sirohydrochlorin ferrochelatase
MRTGFVSIVGGGPGDPELLTRKALRRLLQADLVLFDALVAEDTVRLAPRARCFFVGKRAGRRSIPQATIHRLMIRAARRGERVVRLKGGDPFVLGRGGEEALALRLAGVPFEVVPGVSAAIAAPAAAGIPVTHRGTASAFAVIAGHAEATFAPLLSAIAPGSMTLVVLMGLAQRAAIARLLFARGWPERTPAAIVLGAFTPRAWTWTGELVELGAVAIPEGAADLPGTLIVGDVVALGAGEALGLVREEVA